MKKEELRRTTDVEVLKHCASYMAFWARKAVAENPNTPEEALDELSNSRELAILILVLNHPNTSRETRKKVKADERVANLLNL